MQVLGHETVAGEYHLFCIKATVSGFQPIFTIMFVPAEYLAASVNSGTPAFGGSGQSAYVAQWMQSERRAMTGSTVLVRSVITDLAELVAERMPRPKPSS